MGIFGARAFAHNGLMPPRDAELAERLWEAVSTADVETLERLCTDDLTWHAAGRGPRSGTFRGRDAVLDYLARIGEDADQFASELEDVLVGEAHTALLYRVTGARGEHKLDTGYVLILRSENGRLAEAWSVPRDQHAVDGFWAE
jgi:ketosteroid isomerase-like protein